ncbi:hypothetical protein [Kitasatospora sp. NPDC047058]|uniref:RCC1 domain-containing protein n=1 Tax=Kitasatospora sp. NPDC047058 TaxID=3155620 RepID=UPI0033DF9B0C
MTALEPQPGLRPRPIHPVRRSGALLVAALAAALLLPAPPSARAEAGAGREIRPGVPGTALAWGDNTYATLGDGTTAGQSLVPGRVCGSATCTGPLQDAIAVSAGDTHSVALRADGTVVTWGSNYTGKLGDGTTIDRTTPVQVCAPFTCDGPLTDVVSVSAGYLHTVALRKDGTVVAWGNNLNEQIGDGTGTDRAVPVYVCAVGDCSKPLTDVVAVSAGYVHTLALRSDGSVVAWGNNGLGQLGNGSTTTSPVPVNVCGTPDCTSYLTGVTALAAGATHSMALRADGTVVAWGYNASGQLGDGTTTDRLGPVPVCAIGATAPCGSLLTGVAGIAAGSDHSLALASGGFVRAWGNNFAGQLGDGSTTNRSTPVRVCAPGVPTPCGTYLSGVSAVAAGPNAFHSMAVRSNTTAVTWGSNSFGQLGDGTTTNRSKPVQVCAAGQVAPCTRFLDGAAALSGSSSRHSLGLAVPLADLSLAISAAPEPVPNGTNLTYTVTVHNGGPATAENVVFTETLPANARFVSATPSTGSCTTPPAGSTNSVTCNLGARAGGTDATTTIVVKAVATSGATVTTTAKVTSTTPDPNPDNNSATITTPVS